MVNINPVGIDLITGVQESIVFGKVVTYSDGTPLCTTSIVAHTTDTSLVAEDQSPIVHTNEGASGEVKLTLISAVSGAEFRFATQAAQFLRIVANAGDTIKLGSAAATLVAGFVRSTLPGSFVRLVSVNATEWYAEALSGTWTIDV